MSRGSSWGRWDLHVHTPASYEWRGTKLSAAASDADRDDLMKQVVAAMNTSGCVAVGVMDYWTFDGVKAIRAYLRKAGALQLIPTLFPGIELRMVSPGSFRLNMHVLLNPRLSDDQLDAFKAQLHIANFDRPLVDANLIEFGRERVTDERLQALSLTRQQVRESDAHALVAALKTIEITPESAKNALKVVGASDAILMIPFDTSDGMSKINFREHYNFPRELLAMEAIFEVGSLDTRDAFVGVRTHGNDGFFDAFQAATGRPKLAVRGSDAHKLADYGKSPHEKYTWIKAAPTFAGLLQACKEPANRSYIGLEPPKLTFVNQNPHLFVNGVQISKLAGAKEAGKWFDGTNLEFNEDLVAIIGRKGSGKSALADVIGYLGDTPNSRYFSFLSDKRFRLPRDNKAASFEGRLTWATGAPPGENRGLADGAIPGAVERVKYLPQRYFEELCNDHVEGKDDLLQKELQKVIFSHLSPGEREDARSLDELIETRSELVRERLARNRAEIARLNGRIVLLSERASDERATQLRHEMDLLIEKLRVLKQHEPQVSPAPKSDDPESAALNAAILAAEEELKVFDAAIAGRRAELEATKHQARRVSLVRQRIASLRETVIETRTQLADVLAGIGLQFESLVKFEIDFSALDALEALHAARESEIGALLAAEGEHSLPVKRVQPEKVLQDLKVKLDEPNRKYRQELDAHSEWETNWLSLLGDESTPETFWAVWWELEQMPSLETELNSLRTRRTSTALEILGDIQRLAEVRAALYKPVQDLVDSDSAIREHLHVEFAVKTSFDSFVAGIFDYVKQSAGSFVGYEESKALISKMLREHDLNTESGLEAFFADVETALTEDVRNVERRKVNLANILRADKKPENLFNFIYQLEYAELTYGLNMAGVPLERLSPGQRGALLLIFYLLVDRERIPIVLDQPEENLDNETVFRLLVNVINKAKHHRQVIMITHNANLAVACDAEQIICCDMDRDDGNHITYRSGAIEQLQMNKVVVDVLEGTKLAFDNRSRKYL
ncbi:TrlF family AAA-like ATPase [Paraburkholderia sp. 22B1P]|uniref:TrlF family AAA-like ATPase n=1 Tax=Paraburkholderia sp. 22B1P TaxID=3080498 RepID=UPI0030D35D1F